MVINLFIIYLLLLLAKSVFYKTKSEYLFCGIFAFIGKNPKIFNNDKFNILGTFNDKRGGDAVGIYYDGNLLKSTSPPLYENFAPEHKIDNLEFPFVLGHTRNASVGMPKTIDQAQPIGIKYGEEDSPKEIVLAHNGTIYNSKELATKHDVISTGMSDTQILTDIIAKDGYKTVLGEYIGSAALVWYDASDEYVYVFHGKSKTYSGSTSTEEERPLFWLKEGDHIYISSLESPLKLIKSPNGVIETIPHNTVYKIKNGKIFSHVKINRDSVTNSKHSYTSSTNRNNNYNTYTSRNYTSKDIKDVSSTVQDIIASMKIYFSNGQYYHNKSVAHGKYLVTPHGYVIKDITKSASSEIKYTLEFYKGILLIPGTLDIVTREIQVVLNGNNVNSNNFSKVLEKYAAECFDIPAHIDGKKVSTVNGDFRISTSERLNGSLSVNNNNYYYSGQYTPLFHSEEYKFQVGSMENTTKLSSIRMLTKRVYESWLYYGEEHLKIKYSDTNSDIDKTTTSDNKEDDITYVLCPECAGYSTMDTYCQKCDVCNNTGKVTEEEYDNYSEYVDDSLERKINQLQLTDLSLEQLLAVNNVKTSLKSLLNNLEEVYTEIYEYLVYSGADETISDTADQIDDLKMYLSETIKTIN